MSPGVGRDLVALSIRSLNRSGMSRSEVNLALVEVVSGDKKGSLSIVRPEDIQDVICVVLNRTIVKCNSNVARRGTFVDTLSAILDRSNFCTRHT